MINLKKILLEQSIPLPPDDEEKDSVSQLPPHLMKQALKNKKIQAKRNRKAARKLKRLKLVNTIDLPDGEYKGAYQYENIGGVKSIIKNHYDPSYMQAGDGTLNIGTTSAHDVRFIRQNSTVMTIGSSKIGIGTTAPSTKLDVNGTVTCTGFNNTSDVNLKTNINNIETPLETISKIGLSFS